MLNLIPKRKIIILAIFLFSSCFSLSFYSRQEISKKIKEICKGEFNLEVKVWDVKDTIWVYAPFENIADEAGKWDQKISDQVNNIYLSLKRVILNTEDKPKFYCFVVSDIKQGIDLYNIWFIPDLVRLELGVISRGEFFERHFSFPFLNPSAINDKEGTHILPYDITLGEFVSYLIRQALSNKFNEEKIKNKVKINEIFTLYENKRLIVKVDIESEEYQPHLLDPFIEAKKAIKKFIEIYGKESEIHEIEISDTIKTTLYSREGLLKEKI